MVVKYEYKGLQWWKVQRAYPPILTCLMPGTRSTGVPYDGHYCETDSKGGFGSADLPKVPLQARICSKNLGGPAQSLGEG